MNNATRHCRLKVHHGARVAVTFFVAAMLLCYGTAHAQTLEWTRQLGTSSNDVSHSVSADAFGNVYISGVTEGSMDGTNAGGLDAFLSKYDDSGTLQWTRQLGTSEHDPSTAVSADGLGNVYISGITYGSLDGTNAGDGDAFISKYDATGTLDWTRQLGTSEHDASWAVSADGLGSVYISGNTLGSLGGTNAGGNDAFITKYDASGTLEWTRQLGTSGADHSDGVSADGLGNVYISGRTKGSLDGTNAGYGDAFLTKYDANGVLEWTRQLGTSNEDGSSAVSADALGNVYISGHTRGSLDGTNAGDVDAFISKYDASGTLDWTRQLGTSEEDVGEGVSADGLGGVYMSGWTFGSLDGPNAGMRDAFLARYDDSGALQWTRQFGTSEEDVSEGVSADGLGGVYMSGWTSGSLGGDFIGGSNDAYMAKFSENVPEPGTLALLAVALLAVLPVRTRETNQQLKINHQIVHRESSQEILEKSKS